MTSDWTQVELQGLKPSLADHGIELLGLPVRKPRRLEAITLCSLLLRFLEDGFNPLAGTVNLAKTNKMPFRRITQGSGIGQQVSVDSLMTWMSPTIMVKDDTRAFSFFREGMPTHRGRGRPDLVLVDGLFQIETRTDPFRGETVLVDWSGPPEGGRTYRREANVNGPMLSRSHGEPPRPILGLEISLNKSCDRLLEQFGFLESLGCQHLGAILHHPNPCPPARLHASHKVYTTTSRSEFTEAIEQLYDVTVGTPRNE